MEHLKVLKFGEFSINENIKDVPEKYVENVLRKLKTKFESMFAYDVVDQGKIKKFGEKSKESSETISFKDLNLELQSIELSKYSKLYDNLKIKFSDEQFLYDLTVTIDLKDAAKTEESDEEKDFSTEDIENCQIRFKKYDTDNFELKGELIKTVKVKDVDEDLLVDLKLKLDDEYGGGEEEFEIEVEEEEKGEPE
jgi:hypothetical protein